MQWIAPSEKDTATDTLGKRLRDAPDPLRANSDLKPQEYSDPILGLTCYDAPYDATGRFDFVLGNAPFAYHGEK